MRFFNRRLDDATIDRWGLFTYPRLTTQTLIALNQPFGLYTHLMSGVPGFYTRPDFKTKRVREDKKPVYWYAFNELDGIGIPIRDASNRIIAIQVRCRKANAASKYLWLTSSNEEDPRVLKKEEWRGYGGCSSGSLAHIFFNLDAHRVFFLEGFFKGLALFQQTNASVIAVSGISSRTAALARFKDLLAARARLQVRINAQQSPAAASVLDVRRGHEY